MYRNLFLIAVVAMSPATCLQAHEGYYRYPALQGDTLVFCSEGDLWVTDIADGDARRLTTHPGEESHPALLPDGLPGEQVGAQVGAQMVAFCAEYEGPTEVYVMPISGGVPTRLSYGADRPSVVGWSPDGKVLYSSRHRSTLPDWQLFEVDVQTGDHDPVPLMQASDGVYGDDGQLYFTRFAFQGSSTKRYKGGTARSLWVYGADSDEAIPLTTDHIGEDIDPMWWNGRVYFTSERSGSMNIWSMRPDGSDPQQHTDHDALDVKTPSLSRGRIVYQHGAGLRLLDLQTRLSIELEIDLVTDLDQLRERWIDKPAEWLTSVDLDDDGDRLALTARGEIFIVPAKGGRIAHVARNHGVRYREARFMPDGEHVVALSDESGELDFWTFRADGYGDPTQITNDSTVHRMGTVVSDDGRWIAWHDKDFVLWACDLEAGRSVRVATTPHETFQDLNFSPDSKWLAYVAPAPNVFLRVHLYELSSGMVHTLTSDRVHSRDPVFSEDGTWLYFLSDRHFETLVPSPWGDYQPEPYLVRKTGVFALDLTGTRRSPFQADDELVPSEDDDEADSKDDEAPGEASDDASSEAESDTQDGVRSEPVVYDLVDVSSRTMPIPVPPANRSALAATGDALFWLERPVGSTSSALRAVKIGSDRPVKIETVAEKVARYQVSRNGKRLLITHGDSALSIVDAKPAKADLKAGAVDLARWRLPLDPREEYAQMFTEARRLHRDYFYDPNMHGVDWPAMREKYAPLASRVASRRELNDVVAQMVGELSALHTYVVRGDMRVGDDKVDLGSLGAVLERHREGGGWRIGHIWRADPEYPSRQSPLGRVDLDVRMGDVITHINGNATIDVRDPGVLLRDQAGRQVRLRLAARAEGGEARDIVVVPMTMRATRNLRYDDWQRQRREMIETWSGGAMGYVHVRSMGGSNFADDFARNFYPIFNRQGLVVDMRHNTGGNIDSWILEKLMRRAWMYWKDRAGDPTWNMQHAFRGHMVVLCDEKTASDGEAFCAGFRRLGLGQAIGTRTWGGEIWLSFSNELVDKGIASAAEYGVYGPEGEWLIEGVGFEPDIVVDNLPVATWNGEDAQLRAAFDHLKALIDADARSVPAPPPHPDLSRP